MTRKEEFILAHETLVGKAWQQEQMVAGLPASAASGNHRRHSIQLLLFNPFPNPRSSPFSHIFLDAPPCWTDPEVGVCDDSEGVGLTRKINRNIDLELASLLAQDSGSQDYRCETPPLLV